MSLFSFITDINGFFPTPPPFSPPPLVYFEPLFIKHLRYTYNSTKDKLLLKYFMRKIIWKETSGSWWLLLIFLKNSLHENTIMKKDSLLETTLK